METTQPERRKNQWGHGITVNLNSSGNSVVMGDRIEITIHVADRKSAEETAQAATDVLVSLVENAETRERTPQLVRK